MKKITATLIAMVTSIICALLSSCAEESLFVAEPTSTTITQSISITAKEPSVTVEKFEEVTATTEDGLTFVCSDGNTLNGVLKGGLIGENVKFSYVSDNGTERTIVVTYTAAPKNGGEKVQATTSYIQKIKDVEPEPTQVTVIGHRLSHTRDVYTTEAGAADQVASGVVNAWLVNLYSDGSADSTKVVDNAVYTLYRIAGGESGFRYIAGTDDFNKAYVFNGVVRDNKKSSSASPLDGVTITTVTEDMHFNVKCQSAYENKTVESTEKNYMVEFSSFAFSTVVDGETYSFSYPMVEFTFSEKPYTEVVNKGKETLVLNHTDENGVNYTTSNPYIGTYRQVFKNFIDGQEVDTLTLSTDLYLNGETVAE